MNTGTPRRLASCQNGKYFGGVEIVHLAKLDLSPVIDP